MKMQAALAAYPSFRESRQCRFGLCRLGQRHISCDTDWEVYDPFPLNQPSPQGRGSRRFDLLLFGANQNLIGAAVGGVAALLMVLASGAGEPPSAGGTTAPPPGKASDQTYQVRWLPGAKIVLDGRADEPAWKEAAVEKRFVFPWKQAPAPQTEFRALCHGTNFYFTFRVQDADIVVLDRLRDEQDQVFEDRVEVYLSLDDQMKNYFCFEVDSRGRVFDYRGAYYRHLDELTQVKRD